MSMRIPYLRVFPFYWHSFPPTYSGSFLQPIAMHPSTLTNIAPAYPHTLKLAVHPSLEHIIFMTEY